MADSEKMLVAVPVEVPRGRRCDILIRGERYVCPLLKQRIFEGQYLCGGWGEDLRVDGMEKSEKCIKNFGW